MGRGPRPAAARRLGGERRRDGPRHRRAARRSRRGTRRAMTGQRRLAAKGLRALVATHGTPLLVIDCRAIREQYGKLKRALPGVELYYALKPLPHAAVVAELRDAGACFDVATAGEIRLIRGQGIAADRCIQTHPIKSDAEIRTALRFGIKTFVADNPDEIRKFVAFRKRASLL